jgi:hypothetical protein
MYINRKKKYRIEFICKFLVGDLVGEGVMKVVCVKIEAILCSDTSSCSSHPQLKKKVSIKNTKKKDSLAGDCSPSLW